MKNILNIVEYLSNDRLINKDKILNIVESIIKLSIKKKFNTNLNDIKIIFDRKTCLFKVSKIIKNNTFLDKKENSEHLINNKLNKNNYLEEEIRI